MAAFTGRVALLGIALSYAAGCVAVQVDSQVDAPGAPAGNPRSRNLAVAEAFFEALGHKDRETIARLYADNVKIWVPGELPFSGNYNREDALRGIDGLYQAFPDGLDFEIKAVTAEGDRLALEVESRATHVSGAPYHNYYHYLLVVRDGKIHEVREYLDTLRAYEVMVRGAEEKR